MSACFHCHKPIKDGDPIIYNADSDPFHPDCREIYEQKRQASGKAIQDSSFSAVDGICSKTEAEIFESGTFEIE